MSTNQRPTCKCWRKNRREWNRRRGDRSSRSVPKYFVGIKGNVEGETWERTVMFCPNCGKKSKEDQNEYQR